MHVLPPMPASSEAPVAPSNGDTAAPDETFIALLGAALTEVVDTTSHQSGGVLDGGGEMGDAATESIDVGELLAAGLINLEMPASTADGPVSDPDDADLSSVIGDDSIELDPAEDASDDAADLEVIDPVDDDSGVEVDSTTEDAMDSGAVDISADDDSDPVAEGDDAAVVDDPTLGASSAAGSAVATADAPSLGTLGEFRIPAWIIAQHEEQVQAEVTRLADASGAAASPAATATATATAAATATATAEPTPSMPSVSGQTAAATLTADGDNPWEQLANVVRPLRQLPDGSHRIALQLRPAELGVVHLEVAFEDGRLSLRAVAENLATREVLAAALPELRAELSKSGIDLGSLDVGDQTFGADAGDGGTHAQPTPVDGVPAAPTASPSPESTDGNAPAVHAGGLDLSL
jgi:hypothetical protein